MAIFLCSLLQVVHLREVIPYSAGIVLAFEYMPTDLASVIRDMEKRLTEVGIDYSMQLDTPCFVSTFASILSKPLVMV